MPSKIPAEELHRTEAACNALASFKEDYRYLVRSLEVNYGARIRESHIRRIVGGGAGPEQIVLEEEAP
jgi:hypothetical protein